MKPQQSTNVTYVKLLTKTIKSKKAYEESLNKHDLVSLVFLLTASRQVMTIMELDTFKQDKYSTVGGNGGCRVGEV